MTKNYTLTLTHVDCFGEKFEKKYTGRKLTNCRYKVWEFISRELPKSLYCPEEISWIIRDEKGKIKEKKFLNKEQVRRRIVIWKRKLSSKNI